VIRRYQPTDLAAVMSVWEAASAVAHPFLPEAFLELERQAIPSVHLPRAETWVWNAEGGVVGFIALLGNEVGAIFVHPSFHGLGIGRALMDHARTLRGALEVEVFTANTIGRAFYARYGFRPMHERVHEQTGLAVLRLGLTAAPDR